jgi:hypothetical protein
MHSPIHQLIIDLVKCMYVVNIDLINIDNIEETHQVDDPPEPERLFRALLPEDS